MVLGGTCPACREPEPVLACAMGLQQPHIFEHPGISVGKAFSETSIIKFAYDLSALLYSVQVTVVPQLMWKDIRERHSGFALPLTMIGWNSLLLLERGIPTCLLHRSRCALACLQDTSNPSEFSKARFPKTPLTFLEIPYLEWHSSGSK